MKNKTQKNQKARSESAKPHSLERVVHRIHRWSIRGNITRAIRHCRESRFSALGYSEKAYDYMKQAEDLMRAARSLMR